MSTAAIRARIVHRGNAQDAAGVGPAMRLRLKVAMKRDALNAELAAGAPPALSPELAERASQLTSERRRRELARTWRRTVREAHRPGVGLHAASIIRRGAVIDAEPAIESLIARLGDGAPVAVQGMAMLERLLSDGGSSPLYNATEPGTLRRRIRVATEALDPELTRLPVAA
jgi:hypothetical protein